MNIYFVRHAESEGNVSKLEHYDEVRLTENGRKQAEFVAERFKEIPVDIIVSSTYVRTKETAEILKKRLEKEIIYSDTLIERRLPSEIVGKHTQLEEVQSLYNHLMDNFRKADARHSDEENFEDLKERAGKALDFIKNQPYENVLVVTHSSFLRMLLAYMVFGKEMTGHEFVQIHCAFWNDNAGITFVEHGTPTHRKNEWVIRSWNDSAHLGKAE